VARLLAYILASVVIATLLALQAGKHLDMSGDSSTASASIEAAAGDDKPLGCHSTAEPVSTPAPAAMSSAPSASDAEKVVPGDMQLIQGGRFLMGTEDGLPVEAPVHQVRVKDFWIDRYAVTVAQFEKFAGASEYKTESEKLGWGGVFDVQASSWKRVAGADWRHPEGPSSSALPAEPVTQVSWNDAAAYATWAKKRLPTEAEFEYAARGGLIAKKYAWGDELTPEDQYRANWWQGRFPDRNTGADGFIGRAPAGSFSPNGYGLYDMTGNVWEWCDDWFGEEYYRSSPVANPRGPRSGEHRVIRGGSWLCSDNYCTGYRVAARNHTAPDTGLNNLGFRCVRDR
jgi:sulfatase modifying factor 1